MAKQFKTGLFMVLLIIIIGTISFKISTAHSWVDCLYMTVISITTVGYGETIKIDTPGMKFLTMSLLVSGIGVLLYSQSSITAFIVEGTLGRILEKRKMKKNIDKLSEHIIVCGAGETGVHVIRELVAIQKDFVLIEEDIAKIDRLLSDLPDMLFVKGNATEDEVLNESRIKDAKGLIATLPDDKDNLFLVVTARDMNPGLRIISKSIEESAAKKLLRAGADKIVTPAKIGGLRLASEIVRPAATSFLDHMLRANQGVIRIDEIYIKPESIIANKTILDANVGQNWSVSIIGIRSADGLYSFAPSSAHMIELNSVLIVMGEVEKIRKMQKEIDKA